MFKTKYFSKYHTLSYICAVLCLLLCNSCNNRVQENNNLVWLDNHQFGFEMPKGIKEIPATDELGSLLRQANPSIINLGIYKSDTLTFTFCVSKYSDSIENPIEYAFMLSIKHVPTDSETENYSLMDFNTIKIDNNGNYKYLRYKISSMQNSIYNIMFYFMKNDYSKDLYELKTTCGEEDVINVYDILKKSALSVKFSE